MSEQSQSAIAEPASPPVTQPPRPARRHFSRKAVLLLSGFAALGWIILLAQYFGGSKTGSPESTANAAPVSPETGPLRVEVSPTQLKNIELQKVTERALTRHLMANGRISFNEEQSVPILAPIAGQITGRKVKVGDRVEKGAVLFSLKSREAAAMKSEYQEAVKDRDLADKTCRMTRELFSHNATSNIALQQAENDLAKAQTRVARTAEQLRVVGLDPDVNSGFDTLIPVRAPRDGTVVDSHLAEGQFVQGDATALLTIADLSSVWIVADVFERDLRDVRLKQSAEVATLAYPDVHFTAQVTYISDTVDPLTRAVKVRLLAENPEGRLKPEMFATIKLVLGEDKGSLVIADRAVMTDNGRYSVFVRTAERNFEERAVQVEPAGHGCLRVLHGLSSGEEIVAHGSLLLRHMALSPPQAEG
ncbi:MAG TPA: efflux RND transporter periplasmic adaptor subunit [Phycisphaerae bacterium]|nr:efflux RND transporter periplasmic adaptor subunit [Phycisphaerae bacterium]